MPPTNVSGGGGSRSELVITWEVIFFFLLLKSINQNGLLQVERGKGKKKKVGEGGRSGR